MKKQKYVIVDIEKAGHSNGSICQIGLIVFENGVPVSEFESLVNPQVEFHPIHVNIHGIQADDVVNAPTIYDLKNKLAGYFDGAVVCSYGTSDKFAIGCYFDINSICWMDISKVVRHAIPEFKNGGHKLSKVAHHIGLDLPSDKFHNALVDAKAALEILRYCIEVKNIKPEAFIHRPNISLI